jgi:signal peptidase
VEKETKRMIAVVIVAVAVIAVGFFAMYHASGVNPPQTVVESESMQHGKESKIGVIDTGDMIILKSVKNTKITSYVEGYAVGYKTFGDYGNVIIYDRGEDWNPVIHRAMLWLEYNGDGTWSAPSLKDYPLDLWSCTSGTDCNRLWGTLTLKNLGSEYLTPVNASVKLSELEEGAKSGYLTKGDNNSTNHSFDQPSNVGGVKGLIPYEKIKSVAWIEIPWVGAFKMLLNGDKEDLDKLVPNTIPSLTAVILTVIILLVGISFLFDQRYYKKFRKELYEDMDSHVHSFSPEK